MHRRTFLLATAATLVAQQPDPVSKGTGSLAFVRGGTLWVKDLPDGSPRPLATGNEIQMPKFSPSGQWIVFQDGDDMVRLISADGTSDGKSGNSWPSGQARWLPGRDELAVELDGHSLVFDADDDWRSPRIALPGPIGAISPDGSQRVWESSDEAGKRLLAGPFNRPTEAQVIAETKEGGFEVFAFARGGSRFLYWTTDEDGADVWAGPLDIYMAGGAKPVNTGTGSMTTGLGPGMASLSPTADTLAIVVGEDGNVTNHLRGIALLDISSDSNQPLRKITGPSVTGLHPAWSPDGRQLAWTQGPDADILFEQLPTTQDYDVALERAARERRIWVAGNGGLGEQKPLTSDPRYTDEVPVWSRDGRYILFLRYDEQDAVTHDAVTLWLMRADGTEAREVAALSEKDDSALPDGPELFDWSARL